jgi:hypothetical protein
LILLLLMLPIKTVAFACPKGGNLMKRVLIGGLGILAMIVGTEAANAQASGWDWYAGPGPNKRGGMCITHVDLNRGYGFQAPCPAPKKAAAPATAKKKKVASR